MQALLWGIPNAAAGPDSACGPDIAGFQPENAGLSPEDVFRSCKFLGFGFRGNLGRVRMRGFAQLGLVLAALAACYVCTTQARNAHLCTHRNPCRLDEVHMRPLFLKRGLHAACRCRVAMDPIPARFVGTNADARWSA
jgi:hypothetical protein